MTTIATDGKTMAADGVATISNVVIHTSNQKIKRLPNGSIFGAAGDAGQSEVLFDWLAVAPDERGDFPQIKEVWALVLTPDGTVEAWDDLCAGKGFIVQTPIATGSGERFAIGAMDAGASPEEAVRIAAGRDPCTGGKITVLHIDGDVS